MALYRKTEAISHIPWYYFAAIDNYERNKETATEDEPLISITFDEESWYGIGNYPKNSNPDIIKLFNGIGLDGNGDGLASPEQEEDVLYTLAMLLLQEGPTRDD